jgi:hypothetical protein
MRTITVNVYKFSELEQKVQEHIIKKHYENEDYSFLDDDLLAELLCSDTYFSDVKLSYSLGSCQGDGLSFSGEFDLEKWLNEKETLLPRVKRAVLQYMKIKSNGNQGRYCCARADQVEGVYKYTPFRVYPRLDKVCGNIVANVGKYYVSLCKHVEKTGYAEIEYRMSAEKYSEFADANDYEYDVHGNLV